MRPPATGDATPERVNRHSEYYRESFGTHHPTTAEKPRPRSLYYKRDFGSALKPAIPLHESVRAVLTVGAVWLKKLRRAISPNEDGPSVSIRIPASADSRAHAFRR